MLLVLLVLLLHCLLLCTTPEPAHRLPELPSGRAGLGSTGFTTATDFQMSQKVLGSIANQLKSSSRMCAHSPEPNQSSIDTPHSKSRYTSIMHTSCRLLTFHTPRPNPTTCPYAKTGRPAAAVMVAPHVLATRRNVSAATATRRRYTSRSRYPKCSGWFAMGTNLSLTGSVRPCFFMAAATSS